MIDYGKILAEIQANERYKSNILWGKPRKGHPEGTILAHIQELEANLLRLSSRLQLLEIEKLRLAIHVHDTFKGEAKEGVPIENPESHASLAREFLAGYCDDPGLLHLIQYHDEPYALYQQFHRRGQCDQNRWTKFIDTVEDWDLLTAFLLIDNCTAGKGRNCLLWFFEAIEDLVQARFRKQDIWES